MILIDDLKKRYSFDWEIFDVIIGGQSAIDTKESLKIDTHEQAKMYLDCYGFDLENPIEKAELFGNFQEALNFIRRFFLQPQNPDGLKLEVPRKIAEITDPSQLLLLSSSSQIKGASSSQIYTSLWACSVLKVMHTIAHIDKDLRTNYFTDIQKQIFDRFYKFIERDAAGNMYLGKDPKDPERVHLVAFESKPKKARESVILKLLHKPENVAEDIFDRVGLRFVTSGAFDALRIVKFLKERNVFTAANIKPSRSKNTLIDIAMFKNELEHNLELLKKGEVQAQKMDEILSQLCEKAKPSSDSNSEANPHSSSEYRTIQFTARQLIKIKNSLYDDLRKIRAEIKDEQVLSMLDRLDLRNIQKEVRFFYPFEIQIYDEQSHKENIEGDSSHSNYKKSQQMAAMKRVMGELIRFQESSQSNS